MKIKIMNDKAIITDNSPLIIDTREKAYIAVELPDNNAYTFGFIGKTQSAKSAVTDGVVEIPTCFFGEQTLQTVVYRGNNNGITAIPCEPLRLYKLSNKDMFSLYVESAIGAQDVRDLAAEAIKAYSDMAKALAQLSEDKTRIEKNLTDTKNELESTKEKLTAFEKTYNANIDKINDIIRRVETMEADYDVLIK